MYYAVNYRKPNDNDEQSQVSLAPLLQKLIQFDEKGRGEEEVASFYLNNIEAS